MDMYRSWWFKAVLVLFSVNIVICSFDRLPRIWKLVKEPLQPMPEDRLGKLPINRQIVIKGKPDAVRSGVTEALKTARFRFTEVQEERGYQFYSQKGNYGRLGVYLTHFSILFILIGAMIGMQFGFKGYLNLPEGALSNVAVSNTDKEIPLGFDIRCDSFDVEFYGGSDMPKEYKSWLTIFKDGREVMRKSIVVNDPLTYEGITFYQSSYGMVPGVRTEGHCGIERCFKDRENRCAESEIRRHVPDTRFRGHGKNTGLQSRPAARRTRTRSHLCGHDEQPCLAGRIL